MNYQHKNLVAGRWQELTFFEQMGNIGSEVSRAINWKSKGNAEYSKQAVYRMLELIDLAIDDPRNRTYGRLTELTRAREFLLDFFLFDNQYHFTDQSWRNYFDAFALAARKHC